MKYILDRAHFHACIVRKFWMIFKKAYFDSSKKLDAARENMCMDHFWKIIARYKSLCNTPYLPVLDQLIKWGSSY